MDTRKQNSLARAQALELLCGLFDDLILHHPHLKSSLVRDLDTFKRRLDQEGLGFWMHTLPKLGKRIYSALETKLFRCPLGLKKMKGTALPRFLGGLLKSILHDDGSLREDLDQPVLTDLLEICFFAYKLDIPCAPEKERAVIEGFIKVEEQLSELVLADDDEVLEEASKLVERVLKGFNPMKITPRHGPGSVATGERFEGKWDFKRKYRAINMVYPYCEYFFPSKESLFRRLSWFSKLDPQDTGHAKVCLVPKDSRGPRLISMEPLEYQFIQQGLAQALVGHLEKKSHWTSGYVNFTDQGINRNLALENSLSRDYSTLDMKEASDRVSLTLVRRVFRRRPDVLRCLEGTRTTGTVLPNGQYIELKKFAPMGSALCFPVEALVFWVLAKVIQRRARIAGKVYVYGDDIIVPRDLTSLLFAQFPKWGLMFNEDKCFTDGFFRESCGMDAYKGIECVPVRWRTVLPSKRKQTKEIVSAVDLSNYLYRRGYWRTAGKVDALLNKVYSVRTYRPVGESFAGLSYECFGITEVSFYGKVKMRTRSRYQRKEVCVDIPHQPTKGGETFSKGFDLPCEGNLFTSLIGQKRSPIIVPQAMTLRRRWVPLYPGCKAGEKLVDTKLRWLTSGLIR